MKFKFTILTIIITGFLIGCSDSQNKTSQGKNLDNTATKTQTLKAPKQEPKIVLEEKQPSISEQAEIPKEEQVQNEEGTTQKSLDQEVKSLADALTYDGDDTPREQLERDISEILEAAKAEESATGNNTYK